jgi:cellulose synthase/poly-beta-1,6-N-acetylglucosamine synthase-like glycosyltransferase
LSKNLNPLAIVVLANDEETVIGRTVESAVQALLPEDKLFVIADHCTDDTEKIALTAGAQVIVRNDGGADGKGNALSWFISKYHQEMIEFSAVVILDADSVIKADFIEVIKRKINHENIAYQCFVYPTFGHNSAIGKLAALSELVDQHITDKFRTTFNWPVRLRGTGMVLRPGILIEVSPLLDTYVEDIALSLLLTAKGVPVERIEHAIVYDPKPDSFITASRQRARWFRGQWRALWQYREEIIRIILKGPPGWSLLCSLFLRPKWLVLMICCLLALVLSPLSWLSLIFWSYFIGGTTLLLLGILMIPDSRLFLPATFHIPAYLWMWLQSIILSLQSSTWRRSRK